LQRVIVSSPVAVAAARRARSGAITSAAVSAAHAPRRPAQTHLAGRGEARRSSAGIAGTRPVSTGSRAPRPERLRRPAARPLQGTRPRLAACTGRPRSRVPGGQEAVPRTAGRHRLGSLRAGPGSGGAAACAAPTPSVAHNTGGGRGPGEEARPQRPARLRPPRSASRPPRPRTRALPSAIPAPRTAARRGPPATRSPSGLASSRENASAGNARPAASRPTRAEKKEARVLSLGGRLLPASSISFPHGAFPPPVRLNEACRVGWRAR